VSAEFYVRRAQADLVPLRRLLPSVGRVFNVDERVDVAELASVVCDCELVVVSQLSEVKVFAILQGEYGVDISDTKQSTDYPLAGALCVSRTDSFRWIFVRAEDRPQRQRFTVAHELGHLFIEALVEVGAAHTILDSALVSQSIAKELRLFSRCAVTEAPPDDSKSGRFSRALTSDGLRELRAHHFAAELLMPVDGVRHLIARASNSTGISSTRALNQLVQDVANHYEVSLSAAQRRVEKDLAVVAIENDPNHDLFG
jgi:Zn-dependent peptidase ImmA (M78 family)